MEKFTLYNVLFASLISLFSCKKEPVEPETVFVYDTVYVKDYIDSNNLFKTLNPLIDDQTNKLWGHRINTAEEANDWLGEFPGIEIDLVYESSLHVLDVRHGVDDPYTNNPLEDYFGDISNATDYYYWLDLKNLDDTNCDTIIKRLNYIIDKYNIRQNVILEARDCELLDKFTKNGIYTSYWIPHFSDGYTNKDTIDFVVDIGDNLLRYEVNALSASYKMYWFLDEYFSNCNIHLWTNGLESSEDKLIIEELAKNDNVKVILVDYTSNFLKPVTKSNYLASFY